MTSHAEFSKYWSLAQGATDYQPVGRGRPQDRNIEYMGGNI